MALDPIISASAAKTVGQAVWFDCRPTNDAYRAGHIASALHAHLDSDLATHTASPERGGRHPLPSIHDFTRKLGQWGVTPSSRVLIYDDQNGANAAARLWWMLKAVGHEDVRVIDGGLPALVATGFQLTTEAPQPAPQAPYPATGFTRPCADIDEVAQARTAKDRLVVDVRAAFRYRGESEPLDPIAGHIPGALNLPLTDNLRADGTFKSEAELRALYTAALGGISPEQTIVHCGSGVTACHTLLALERANLLGAKLYVGSWSEWCRNEARPRATGPTAQSCKGV